MPIQGVVELFCCYQYKIRARQCHHGYCDLFV